MDLTFISLLRVLPKCELSCSVQTAAVRASNMHPRPSAAIERGCSIGANRAQKLSADEFGSKDAPRCHRTIQDNPRTFQQALDAGFS
jgi:hypothetical protein